MTVHVIGNGKGHDIDVEAAVSSLTKKQVAEITKTLKEVNVTDENVVQQHVAAIALRNQNLPWSAVGQALGFGNPSKPRSGAGSARRLVETATQAQPIPAEEEGGRGTSAAQAAMPLTRKSDEQE